jgi:hypothetical protein
MYYSRIDFPTIPSDFTDDSGHGVGEFVYCFPGNIVKTGSP